MDWLSPSLPFLSALQKLTFLSTPAKFLSFLGKEEFFLFLLPLIYWCLSRRNGTRVGVLFLFSVVVNEIIKIGFALPRPYWIDPSLKMAVEDTFGFPSGHAQNAALIWPFLAAQSRKPKVWVPLSLLLALAIAFSRLYLGVHFPADAFGGALIGFAILGFAYLGEKSWVPFWRESPFATKITVIFFCTFILAAFYLGAVFVGPYKTPADYNSPSLAALQDALTGHNISSQLGALFGFLLALAVTAQCLNYNTEVTPEQKVVRFLVGVLGLAVFYFGLKMVLPDTAPFRFTRYALTTFWVGFGAPWVFAKLERGSRVPQATTPQEA